MTKGRRESAHFPNKVLGGATVYTVWGFGLSLSEYGVLKKSKAKGKALSGFSIVLPEKELRTGSKAPFGRNVYN